MNLEIKVTFLTSSLRKRSYKLSKVTKSFSTISRHFDCDELDLKQKTMLLRVESRFQIDLR